MGNKLATPVMNMISLSRIEIGDRRRVDLQNLDVLMRDIKDNGLIQPIAVRVGVLDEDKFVLLAGGRRVAACTQLGHIEIPARIYPSDLDELDLRTIELAENLHRANLLYPEEARLTREIHALQVAKHGNRVSTSPGAPGHSIADTATILNRSSASVIQEIHLADAMDKIPQLAACKNKSDALKTLAKIKETIVHQELASRVTARMTEAGSDKTKKRLMDAYIVSTVEKGCEGVKDGSLDLVEMDPPYGIDLRKIVEASVSQVQDLMGQRDLDAVEYMESMRSWYQLAYDKLKPNGWLILWFAMEPWIEPTYQLLKEIGFELNRVPGLWVKNNGNTRTPNIHLANSYEPFFYARKGNPVLNRMGRINTFVYPMLTNKIHPTEKPVELYADIFSTFCLPSSTIMSGFLGSGNALLGASNAGHIAFGFDMNKQYKDQYILRVENGTAGEYTSY